MQSLAPVFQQEPVHPSVDHAALAFLRVTSARNRCLARGDLFKACAALSVDPAREAEALAHALFSAFDGQGHMPRLQLYQVTADEVTFDERWLLSAIDAAARDDRDSLTFLLMRRVPKYVRRHIGFLISALAKSLPENR
jgi:hypothetical protein